MSFLVYYSIGVAFVLRNVWIQVFPGKVAADRKQKGVGFRIRILPFGV